MLEHHYGMTMIFGGWVCVFYGAPLMTVDIPAAVNYERRANCLYGLSIGPFFFGVAYATDADLFEPETE